MMEVLKELCNLRGVSGNETVVADTVMQLFSKNSDKCYKDKMGNVIAKIDNGADFTVLVEAHLDEIGLIVSEIDSNGFIKFTSVGGINSAILPAKEVIVHGKKDLFGVIGAKPPHLMTDDEKNKKPEFDSLFIDVGFGKEELEKYVSVGDVISFKGGFLQLQNGAFASKSVDNRAGVYILYKLMERLKGETLNINLVFLAAVQEELGCLGAKTAVFDLQPDYSIVIDVTHAKSNYIDKYQGYELSGGPTVGVGPNFSNIYNDRLLEFCRNNGVKYQIEVCEGHSGTDAWPIQISRNGIPCSLLSVPLRYMHSEVEVASFKDIDLTVDILLQYLKEVV